MPGGGGGGGDSGWLLLNRLRLVPLNSTRVSAHYHHYPRIQARMTVGTADVSPDDMTVAIDEELEGLEEVSGDEAGEVKKELF